MHWIRGREGARYAAAALLAMVAAAARSEDLNRVRQACESVRRTVQSARATAVIERSLSYQAGSLAKPGPSEAASGPYGSTPPPELSRNVSSRERWAFAGEKRYYQPLPGLPTAYDGVYVRTRLAYSGLPSNTVSERGGPRRNPAGRGPSVQIRGSIARAQIRPRNMSGDPVNYGYRILWREPEGPDVNFWMRDLLRRIEPTLATLPSGNLELKWNRRIGRQREEGVVELDPRRNYLIVRHQRRWQSVGPNGEERRASQSLRVLESKDMGGWHLPIASVEEEAQPDGTVSRLETRLTKISTTVSDSLFTDIFEPGDWVETETGPYRVGYGGRLEAVSPYPRFERSDRGRFPVLPAAIAGIVGTAAFLYAALRGRAQARTAGRAAIDRKLR